MVTLGWYGLSSLQDPASDVVCESFCCTVLLGFGSSDEIAVSLVSSFWSLKMEVCIVSSSSSSAKMLSDIRPDIYSLSRATGSMS